MHCTSIPTAHGRAEPFTWKTCMWCRSSEVQHTVLELHMLLLLLWSKCVLRKPTRKKALRESKPLPMQLDYLQCLLPSNKCPPFNLFFPLKSEFSFLPCCGISVCFSAFLSVIVSADTSTAAPAVSRCGMDPGIGYKITPVMTYMSIHFRTNGQKIDLSETLTFRPWDPKS